MVCHTTQMTGIVYKYICSMMCKNHLDISIMLCFLKVFEQKKTYLLERCALQVLYRKVRKCKNITFRLEEMLIVVIWKEMTV